MEFKAWIIITSVKRLKTNRIHLILLTHLLLREVSVYRLFEDRFAKKKHCKIDSKKAFCCVLHESFFQFCRSIFNKLVSFQSSSESPDYFNNFVFFF